MRREYKYARINYGFDDKGGHLVFIEEYLGEQRVLSLAKIETILNEYAKESEELKKEQKRNYSLSTRISDLREELEKSKKRNNNDAEIRDVCKIIQDRIDFMRGEPVMNVVFEHLTRIKENLIKEELWRS